MERVVVGISGASGIILAKKTIRALAEAGFDIEVVSSRSAVLTAVEEMGSEVNTPEKIIGDETLAQFGDQIRLHRINDFASPIASGSFLTKAMIIVPCSMNTMAAVAMGLSDNLIRRAADVTLKERRPLAIVPRETPFHQGHIENMLRISKMGGVIVPPIPAWYSLPKTLDDIEDFIVGRTLDAVGIHTDIYPRWKSEEEVMSSQHH